MIKAFYLKHKFAFTWLGAAFLIKGTLFILFSTLLYQNWPRELITNYIYIASNDTSGYYDPVENFINNGFYDSYCRMPGLLPIYGPLFYIFGGMWAKTCVILIQFIVSTISVYLLAKTSVYIFKALRLFYYTFFLYAISSFVSNWDHFGLSDSFGTSFLIYAIYFGVKFKHSLSFKDLLLSGAFMTWSLFFRPVHGVVIPLLIVLYLLDPRKLTQSFKNCIVFSAPILLFLGIWTFSNYKKTQQIVVLQGPNGECFKTLTPPLLAIRELIISWGGDYQPWSKNSEAEWFLNKKIESPSKESISQSYYTSAYNYDSLLVLRQNYIDFCSDTLVPEAKEFLSKKIIETSTRYTSSYKSEHAISYYLVNRFKLLLQLLVPHRLDDFPTPKYSVMNFLHKGLKAFYFVFLLFILITGFLACVYGLYKRIYFAFIPLTLVLLIGFVLGYVEQRYLVPAYPFLLIFAAWALRNLLRKKNFSDR